MINYFLALLFLILASKTDSLPIQLLLVFFLTLYSYKKRTAKLIYILVTLMFLKFILFDKSVISLYTGVHSNLYDSFSYFIDKTFPSKYSIFLISITVGTSNVKLPTYIYDAFKRFNLLHVVSISGANFSLIKDLLINLNFYINKNIVLVIILLIQIYYILLIGAQNLPALRAFLFSAISIYSAITGRPITFISKLMLAILIIAVINPDNITNSGLLLSIGFSILYKMLEYKPLSTIFNNELKKIALTFIITVLIFNSTNPDFIANLLFAITYPIIFINTFLLYLINLFGSELKLLIELTKILVQLLFDSLKELTSEINTIFQALSFVVILAIILRNILTRKKYEYLKFAQ